MLTGSLMPTSYDIQRRITGDNVQGGEDWWVYQILIKRWSENHSQQWDLS